MSTRNNSLEYTYPETYIKLRAWGAWASSDSNYLWYPKASIIQAIMDGRTISSKSGGARRLSDDEVAEDMEKRLLKLSKRNQDQFAALKLYFQKGNMTVISMALSMKLPKDRARCILREGVAWVDGGFISA